MEIKLNNEESERYFFDAMCNGMGYFGGYGVRLDYKDSAGDKSREVLAEAAGDRTICREDVWMQILRNGDTLVFEDEEMEEKYNVTLKDVHSKVQLTPPNHLMDMVNDRDDAITSDCILQTVIFGEVKYG